MPELSVTKPTKILGAAGARGAELLTFLGCDEVHEPDCQRQNNSRKPIVAAISYHSTFVHLLSSSHLLSQQATEN